MKRTITLALGLTALALLAGCGIKSGLTRPDPMWGTASAERADAERKAEADAARAERAARTGETPPQIPEPGALAPSTVPTPPPATTPAP